MKVVLTPYLPWVGFTNYWVRRDFLGDYREIYAIGFDTTTGFWFSEAGQEFKTKEEVMEATDRLVVETNPDRQYVFLSEKEVAKLGLLR